MNQENQKDSDQTISRKNIIRFLLKWLSVTAISWAFGLLLGFLFAGLGTELLAIVIRSPNELIFGNVILGFVLGSTVGLAQRLILPKPLSSGVSWSFIPGIVLASGYFILETMLYIIEGTDSPPPVQLWSIIQIILFVVTGAISGYLQSGKWPKGWPWSAGNALGWGAALAVIQYASTTNAGAIPDIILFLSGLILSGLLLGVFTSAALIYQGDVQAHQR
jgi:hypothetical protein